MDVNPERMMDAARALEYVGLARKSDVWLIWLNPLLGSAAYEPLTRGA